MAHGLVIRNGQVIDETGRPCFLNRGELRTGAFADRNRIDLDDAGLPVPAFVHDFPHGAGCFRQGAFVYDATIVNGRVVMDHGRHTGEFAGQALRGGC